MKTLIAPFLAALLVVSTIQAHPQVEHLKEAYKALGDSLFVPLYWLPETRAAVRKHISDVENWVGFEQALWRQLSEAEKLKIVEELGAEFEQLEGAALNATWKRIRDWQSISSQLGLFTTFCDSQESFLEMAYEDPALRQAFDWVVARRKPGFDTRHIASTLSSGETALFFPVLIEHLLNTPEQQRFECFSRLFAKIAEMKSAEAEQVHGDQPPNRPGSKDAQ